MVRCPVCDEAGGCTFECKPGWSLEERDIARRMQVVLLPELLGFVGRSVTPELLDEMTDAVVSQMPALDAIAQRAASAA